MIINYELLITIVILLILALLWFTQLFKLISKSGGFSQKEKRKISKFIFAFGGVGFGIWLVVALGPLWIIAIVLVLILFVLLNK